MLYLITCESTKHRLPELLEKLKNEEVSIVNSFDKNWIESWTFLFNVSKDSLFDREDECHDLSDAEIGCYLAHMEVFRRFLTTEEKYLLSFEDDVDLPENWKFITKKALEICEKDKIHYCSLGDWGEFDKNAFPTFARNEGQYTRCTHAHIIRRDIVKLLYNKRFPICRSIDHFINHIFKKSNLHNALHFNPGFAQKNVKSEIRNSIINTEYKIFV